MIFSLVTGWLVDHYSFRPVFLLFGMIPLASCVVGLDAAAKSADCASAGPGGAWNCAAVARRSTQRRDRPPCTLCCIPRWFDCIGMPCPSALEAAKVPASAAGGLCRGWDLRCSTWGSMEFRDGAFWPEARLPRASLPLQISSGSPAPRPATRAGFCTSSATRTSTLPGSGPGATAPTWR